MSSPVFSPAIPFKFQQDKQLRLISIGPADPQADPEAGASSLSSIKFP